MKAHDDPSVTGAAREAHAKAEQAKAEQEKNENTGITGIGQDPANPKPIPGGVAQPAAGDSNAAGSGQEVKPPGAETPST